MVCVPFSLGSIYKYWISVNEDTSRKDRWRKCANVGYLKTRCFYSFTFNSKPKLEKFSTLLLRHFIIETVSLRDLTRFYVRLFELEILEIFTTASLLKIFNWSRFFFQVLQSALWWSIAFILTSIINVI